MDTRTRYIRAGIAVLVGTAMALFGAGGLYLLRAYGELYSVRSASQHLGPLFLQNLMTSLFPILLVIVSALWLKRDFLEAMYLKIRGERQFVYLFLLSGTLVIMTMVGIAGKKDPVTVLYALLYYLMFVAFAEEFVFRGLCSYLLRDHSQRVRFLLPSFLFAMSHIFAYNDFSALTGGDILSFVLSDLLGLFLMGCAFQFLKEKTGTLWVPVLLHAVCDFGSMITG